jgi:hypothetical protein
MKFDDGIFGLYSRLCENYSAAAAQPRAKGEPNWHEVTGTTSRSKACTGYVFYG